MTAVSYRNFTGTAAENYQRHFVPAIAEPGCADARSTLVLTSPIAHRSFDLRAPRERRLRGADLCG